MGKVQQRAGGAGKKLILSMMWIYEISGYAKPSAWYRGVTSRGDVFLCATENAEYDFAKFSYSKNGYITTIEFKKTFKVLANIIHRADKAMKINGNDVKVGDVITPSDVVTLQLVSELGNLVLLEEV